MILVDVNILVYSFRKDSENHKEYKKWLLDLLEGDSQYAYSEQILSSVIRICTHPKIFHYPSNIEEVFKFAEVIREYGICVIPGERHWNIFKRLCKENGIKGNLVADAYIAATAIEYGCELATTDHDFARFRKLKCFHPLSMDR